MLTDAELKELNDKAQQLPNGKLEQALRFALVEQEYRQSQSTTDDTERVDAWITALRLEQARRAGKLRTLTDPDTDALARLWPQIARYRDALIQLGLEVHLQVDEIDDHLMRVHMILNGDADAINLVADQWEKVELAAGSVVKIKERGIVRVGGGDATSENTQCPT